MDIRNWCSSGCKTACSGRGYHEIGSNKLKLKELWMKLKKEKRKIFESPARAPYDPHTYSQNFDHGFTWDEPDNLSRSFSMRVCELLKANEWPVCAFVSQIVVIQILLKDHAVSRLVEGKEVRCKMTSFHVSATDLVLSIF
ncbi:hypothetical protein V6N13_081594 [Hibiscus sabdariffa]